MDITLFHSNEDGGGTKGEYVLPQDMDSSPVSMGVSKNLKEAGVGYQTRLES